MITITELFCCQWSFGCYGVIVLFRKYWVGGIKVL
jgi:hypothetical protein